jgi:hypothetical protein
MPDLAMSCHIRIPFSDQYITYGGHIAMCFEHGQKPYKHYLKKFQDTPTDVKIAGNFSNFGNTTRKFQQIAITCSHVPLSRYRFVCVIQSFLHLEDFMWKLPVTGTSASKYSPEIPGPNIALIVSPLNVSYSGERESANSGTARISVNFQWMGIIS